MSLTARYELNNPPMIAELVEGEVIAIDLDRGTYYSMVGAAADIWRLLVAGYAPSEILAAVPPGTTSNALADSLGRFTETLLSEQLIREAKAETPSNGAIGTVPAWAADVLRVDRFTDMQDLLVLDPIHDVDDEAGWPKPVA